MTLWPNGSTTIPRVTDEFGMRVNPVTGDWSMHSGIDLVGWVDNVSPVDGVVILASYNGGAGNEVRVRADNGDVFRMLHNASIYVVVGQRVRAGQPVGRMGTTGQSTGVHCHFETKPGGGAAINPRVYMAANLSPAGGGSTLIDPEDDDMSKTTGIATTDEKGQQLNALVNPDSGFFSAYLSNEGGYNSAIAAGFDTGNYVPVSLSHFRKLEADCAAVRAGK